MKVPISWLKDLIDIQMSPRELAASLTAAGLKVEAIHEPGAEISGVVVAEVIEVMPHPNADRLTLVDVLDEQGPRRVVCGAKNISSKDRIPLAVPGATLPGGVKIGTSKIRGETSNGMLCSGRELGIGDDHSGILILAPDSPIGADVKSLLGLDDVVLELEITPNRPDQMSLIGVAREVSAITGAPMKLPEVPKLPPVQGSVEVEITDPERCSRYFALTVEDVTVGKSSDLIQKRLLAAGIRPVSNVVDASNYVLIVTGHPTHAFDKDKLKGHIVVRQAAEGETIETIDGASRELDQDDLVIADLQGPVAIAGVMGGRLTEVSDATKNILIESAHFDPRSVMRSSKRHGLRSEASSRFERGADPASADFAAAMVAGLVVSSAGGKMGGDCTDAYARQLQMPSVAVRVERARTILGVHLEEDVMLSALQRLSLDASLSGGVITVNPPTSRQDLRQEEDLIEEIARITGYEAVPSTLPSGANRSGALTKTQKQLRSVRSTLVGAGLYEAVISIMVGPSDLQKMSYPDDAEGSRTLKIANPLALEESILRPSLLPGLIQCAKRNLSRRELDVRLFEVGSCFIDDGAELPTEPLRLGMILAGRIQQDWLSSEREIDFYDLKGAIEVLKTSLRIDHLAFEPLVRSVFHPTRAARILAGGEEVGVMGEASSAVAAAFDVEHRMYLAEIDLTALFAASGTVGKGAERSRFPEVFLDLAVIVDESVPGQALVEQAEAAGVAALRAVRIFDVYRGDQVGEAKKSVALSLTFGQADRTLTEEEALAGRNQIIDGLKSRFGAKVRD